MTMKDRERFDEARIHLHAWLRDFGANKPKTFVDDIQAILDENDQLRKQDVRSVLLSEEFLKGFAAAFSRTPIPSSITSMTSEEFELATKRAREKA